MNNFKRKGLDTLSYIKNRENQFKLMQNNQNRISTIIRKDFLNSASDGFEGRDSIGLQNDIAVGSGRNVRSLNPSIYQEIFNDVINNKNINNDVKQKIVEEIYRINDNLTINNQVYDNLKSEENSLTLSEISPELLDASFDYNLDYLNEFSKQIRATAKNGELSGNNDADKAILDAIFSASDKATSNSTINKSEVGFTEYQIQDEFDIQNAVHRSKKQILSNDKDIKKNLENIREYNQEIGNSKTLGEKFSKLPERLEEINNALNAISKERTRLNEIKTNLDNSDQSETGYKKAKQSYENDLKNLDKEAKGLIKELKGISEFAFNKEPSRDESEKKSKFENVGNKIDKDINYATRLINDLNEKDFSEDTRLENKVKSINRTFNDIISNNQGINKDINSTRGSIQDKLKQNAQLYKERDELKIKLKNKTSVNGVRENVIKKGSTEYGKIQDEIKELDQGIKENNQSIKESLGSIKKMKTTELKDKTKEIKNLNKSYEKSLKFQEKNPLKQEGNFATRFLDRMERKITSFTSRIEERLSRGSDLRSKEALADGTYLKNLANTGKKAVGTALAFGSIGAEKTAEAAKTAGKGVVKGAKAVGQGALLVGSLPVVGAMAAGHAAVKGAKAVKEGVVRGAENIQNKFNDALSRADNTIKTLRVALGQKIAGKDVEIVPKQKGFTERDDHGIDKGTTRMLQKMFDEQPQTIPPRPSLNNKNNAGPETNLTTQKIQAIPNSSREAPPISPRTSLSNKNNTTRNNANPINLTAAAASLVSNKTSEVDDKSKTTINTENFNKASKKVGISPEELREAKNSLKKVNTTEQKQKSKNEINTGNFNKELRKAKKSLKKVDTTNKINADLNPFIKTEQENTSVQNKGTTNEKKVTPFLDNAEGFFENSSSIPNFKKPLENTQEKEQKNQGKIENASSIKSIIRKSTTDQSSLKNEGMKNAKKVRFSDDATNPSENSKVENKQSNNNNSTGLQDKNLNPDTFSEVKKLIDNFKNSPPEIKTTDGENKQISNSFVEKEGLRRQQKGPGNAIAG